MPKELLEFVLFVLLQILKALRKKSVGGKKKKKCTINNVKGFNSNFYIVFQAKISGCMCYISREENVIGFAGMDNPGH